ncbi:MAG TPA: polysaccharide deacetylase family protein [Candidatus Sumerlaeota bacterium]|nr:polysaccharide deacetylase family protein [Candidatus Sumerlaeota bacterium]
MAERKRQVVIRAARRPMLCLRMDLDTLFTPYFNKWLERFGDGELQYVPRLLDQARELEVPLHFFAQGMGVIQYPDLLRRILAAGFAVDSHLHTHRITLIDDYGLIFEEVLTAEHLLKSIGAAPTGIGATGMYPEGIDGREDVQRLLMERGYHWVSSRFNLKRTLHEMQPYRYPNGLLELPCAGWSDFTWFYASDQPTLPEYDVGGSPTLEQFIRHVQDLTTLAARDGLILAVCLHPGLLAAHDPELHCVPRVIQHARRLGVEPADLRTIAAACPPARGG